MISTLANMCGSVLSEYMGTGNDKDEKFLQTIHVRENMSCSSKIESPYYTVANYPKFVLTVGYPERVELSEILWSTTQNAQSVRTNPIFCAEKERLLSRKI